MLRQHFDEIRLAEISQLIFVSLRHEILEIARRVVLLQVFVQDVIVAVTRDHVRFDLQHLTENAGGIARFLHELQERAAVRQSLRSIGVRPPA